MNTTAPCYLSDAAAMSFGCGGGGGVDGAIGSINKEETAAGGSSSSTTDEVDVDSYAIIPASTLFTHIVPTVLRKLGYSDDIIFSANGWLIMKNWRPLSLTQIASSERETVGGVLGELTTVATIRIYIRKSCIGVGGQQDEMKSKVLRWLMAHSQSIINSSRFPLSEKWQQKVMRGERPSTPSPDTRRQFDIWFQQEMARPSQSSHHHHHHQHSHAHGQQQLLVSRTSPEKNQLNRISPSVANDLSSAVTISDLSARDVLPPRVRMRTTFDPEQELPRLQRWFSDNQHPTRFQLQLYVQELNELDSRRGRKPLDVSNLVYWFKNARAAYKRAEVRNNQSESNVDCWTGSLHSMQGCLGEESSDDNRRLEDDDDVGGGEGGGGNGTSSSTGGGTTGRGAEDVPVDDGDEDNDNDDRSSVVSDQSQSRDQHFDRATLSLKMEPADLNLNLNRSTDTDAEKGDQDSVASAVVVRRHQLTVDEDDYDDESQQSDSESDMEDYAENLSLSKNHATDDDVTATSKKSDSHQPTSSSNQQKQQQQQDYTAAYPGFPLSLSHAQLNPHGLVYMAASPYLQSIGTSLLHQSGSATHHHLGSHNNHHHHHHHHRTATDGLDPLGLPPPGGSDDRRKRNRTFIDPVTEVPRLEHWFSLNTHPSHSLVLRYTEELNRQPYRLKFPKLEPKNVQFWFKNRRAKCKRLKLSL